MIDRKLIYDTLRVKMEDLGFHFEREQNPHHQNRREMELKFIHPQLIKKWEEEGFKVRAKKFYIKPLSDEPDCEIGLVTGKSSPLYESKIFGSPNSYDSFDDTPAWTNRGSDEALDNLLKSIKKYLDSSEDSDQQSSIVEAKINTRQRNPKWERDEIILALDLYFKLESGQIHSSNPQIIELSELLNKLPIHKWRPNANKFRNPNGVSLKLGNFLAIDPAYEGKGMVSFSRLDEEIFNEFNEDRGKLSQIAEQIKKTVTNQEITESLEQISDEESDEVDGVKEGRVLYKLHKYKERDPSIARKRKQIQLKRYGCLKCEVCDFDFVQEYGELGTGFIECHHKVPLAEFDSVTETRLEDLALVCANCHRMLHKRINTLNVEELKVLIEQNGNSNELLQ